MTEAVVGILDTVIDALSEMQCIEKAFITIRYIQYYFFRKRFHCISLEMNFVNPKASAPTNYEREIAFDHAQ